MLHNTLDTTNSIPPMFNEAKYSYFSEECK